jgi:hypothetical protein
MFLFKSKDAKLADTLLNRLPRTYCVAQVPVRAAPVCMSVGRCTISVLNCHWYSTGTGIPLL